MKETNANVKPNVFVRIWKKLRKFCADTVSELKKVVWTPKAELAKSSKLVIVTVLVISIAVALIDLGSSWVINSLAKLVG